MIGWLIYNHDSYTKNRWFAHELMRAANNSNLSLELKLINDMNFGIQDGTLCIYDQFQRVNFPDFVIMRIAYPFLSKFFEHAGTIVYNSSVVSELCNNKCETYLRVSQYYSDILDVNFYDKRCQSTFLLYQGNSVVKSSDGHGGNEVELISDSSRAPEIVSRFISPYYLIQAKYHALADDVRIYVLGNRIVCSVKRFANGLKSNYSLGASVEPYQLSQDQQNIVLNLIQKLGLKFDFVGIDFFVNDGDFIFNEIEDVVGSRMLYQTYNYDIAQLYIDYVASTLFERSDEARFK